MFFEISLVPLEILVEHVLPTKFVPSPKMVDFHPGENPRLFKHPVDLFLIAPHDVPIIVVGLFPLPPVQTLEDTISEVCLELYTRSVLLKNLRVDRVMLFFYVSAEVLGHNR